MSECKSGRGQQEDTARSDCGRGHGGPFLSTLGTLSTGGDVI
jgi:hypothetical protein